MQTNIIKKQNSFTEQSFKEYLHIMLLLNFECDHINSLEKLKLSLKSNLNF